MKRTLTLLLILATAMPLVAAPDNAKDPDSVVGKLRAAIQKTGVTLDDAQKAKLAAVFKANAKALAAGTDSKTANDNLYSQVRTILGDDAKPVFEAYRT
ncbi:MAG: hypothetical protein HN909_03130, partial [Phycisphaerales bacterium]|nr:hypothetical protein [Phycisphaerales bacterium]